MAASAWDFQLTSTPQPKTLLDDAADAQLSSTTCVTLKSTAMDIREIGLVLP
jgi:hypothetical protein